MPEAPFAAFSLITSDLQTQCPPRVEIRRDLWLDARLALWLAELRILVVADLHWGYADSHRAQGNLLPAWGDADIARRLNSLIADYVPAEMIWLGDSLHTLAGTDAASAFLRASPVPVTIVSGNHDARWSRAEGRLALRRSNFFLHHGDRAAEVPDDTLEIVGHYHPAIAWHDGAGARLKLPALVAGRRRLVLPAFSPWAGGVPWSTPAADETVYAIGSKRIFTVPRAHDHKDS
ncbi:MAG TPA: metallophosphoesterase [Opitutus sp.]|nr:metallophosphoesterase [Opitutus sp.]